LLKTNYGLGGLNTGMAADYHELTGFQRDLLYVIAGFDRPSGQRVASALEERRQDKITHGRLYPNLDALVDAGLVEKGESSRRTNFYALTSDGETVLRSRRAWENNYFEPS